MSVAGRQTSTNRAPSCMPFVSAEAGVGQLPGGQVCDQQTNRIRSLPCVAAWQHGGDSTAMGCTERSEHAWAATGTGFGEHAQVETTQEKDVTRRRRDSRGGSDCQPRTTQSMRHCTRRPAGLASMAPNKRLAPVAHAKPSPAAVRTGAGSGSLAMCSATKQQQKNLLACGMLSQNYG